MRHVVSARWDDAATMNKLLVDFRNLHRAPDDWELRHYASHAWRLARGVWLFMIVFCLVLGAALPPHNPAKMFAEYRPFTHYTVVLLAVCGVVCAQCARLTAASSRTAWTLLAIGFFFLATDDLTQIHERLDKELNHYLGLPSKAGLSDLLGTGILVLYGIVGAIALYYHRHHFFRLKGFEVGIVKAAGAAVVLVILHVVGELVDRQASKAVLEILEESCKALAISRLFWTFVTARFQLRRADEYLHDALTASQGGAATPAAALRT